MNAFSFHYVSLIPLHKWHAVHFTSTTIIHKVGPIFTLLFTQENSQGDARWPSSATAAGEVRLDPSHTYTTTHHTHITHTHTVTDTTQPHNTYPQTPHTHALQQVAGLHADGRIAGLQPRWEGGGQPCSCEQPGHVAGDTCSTSCWQVQISRTQKCYKQPCVKMCSRLNSI